MVKPRRGGFICRTPCRKQILSHNAVIVCRISPVYTGIIENPLVFNNKIQSLFIEPIKTKRDMSMTLG
jgi:hypothetical protein